MKNRNNICLRAVTLAIMAACLIATSCKANAQRTMNGQSMVCLEAATSLLRLRDAGAEICYGQYLLGGYWYAGGGAMWHRVVTTGRSPMSFIDMCASGGYMHRIFCTRSRNLCLYAGGGLTADSVAEDEWLETEQKSQLLLNLISNSCNHQ